MGGRLVLGFDTSAAHCAAALLSGDRIVAQAHEPMDRGQAERLMPMLEAVLGEAGATWRDLARIGVGTGPGNFTGVRIAVAAARGLALGLGIPAIGVPRLEALALGHPRPLTVVDGARGGAVHVQSFGQGGPGPVRIAPADDPGPLPGLRVGLDGQPARYPPAEAVARIAAARSGAPQPRPAPVYLRAADAALPADPPPRILHDPP